MASPNPLTRTTPLIHLPLLALATVFALPLLWLLLTSLQPREQVGKIPPEWLPRQAYIQVAGETISVTPALPVGKSKLVVVPSAGPQRGKHLLVEPADFHDGQLEQRIQVADRVLESRYPAQLVQSVPAHFVIVKEWFLSKYAHREARVFYVEPGAVKSQISPIFGNYSEAVRALTASERDKALPLGELLARSSLPWTQRGDREKTITFLTYLSNTLLVALLSVLGTLTSSSLVAYGLSRIEWKGRATLFSVTLATMMVPFPVLMVPLYGVFRSLGWIGTLLPLWVPTFFGGAFNIFLLRQFFLTIPSELSDAARIDGCSEFEIFWRIILPLSRPALSVVALFTFLGAWNEFLAPLIFLTEPETFTMALGLQQYQSQFAGSEWHLLMGASALLVMPIIVLFFFAQKTFIQGISTTGMGGR
ncbi:MAG TPA: carbohydrate ABC transporter permease [Polyangiaceae bacterium]|nr:carbohydrate ABC transporter permease [Polyangiaceae bacterium]